MKTRYTLYVTMALMQGMYIYAGMHGDINANCTENDFDLSSTSSRPMKGKARDLDYFKPLPSKVNAESHWRMYDVTDVIDDVTDVIDDDLSASETSSQSMCRDRLCVLDCVEGHLDATSSNPGPMEVETHRQDSFKPACSNNEYTVFHGSYDVTDCVDDDDDEGPSMKSEKNRLDTFRSWPVWSVQSPSRLAEAGLYYSGQGDKVNCAFCHGILKSWNIWDIPIVEHSRHFPRCPFVLCENVGNIPIDQSFQRSANCSTPVNIQIGQNVQGFLTSPNSLNISAGQRVQEFVNSEQPSQAVNLLDFTRESNRLATYSRWPSYKTQTPETLARAGFYHTPCEEKLDRVQCAYCHGRLFNWAEQDDPWSEHARCYPNCPYVKLCVNRAVVENLQRESSERRNHTVQTTPFTPSALSNDDVSSAMASAAAMAVMEMGFTSDQVKAVLDKHFKSGKELNLSAEQLATEILEDEDSKLDNSGSNATGTNSHSRSRENSPVIQSNVVSRDKNKQSTVRVSDRDQRCDKPNWKKHYLCTVCSENQKMVTFLPCGHLTCCNSCSLTITECPICRTTITSSVRTYY